MCSESVNGDCKRAFISAKLRPRALSSLPLPRCMGPHTAAGMAKFNGEFVANCSASRYHLTPSILPFSAFASLFFNPASNRLAGLTQLHCILIPAAARGTHLEYEQRRRSWRTPGLLLESPPGPEVSTPQASPPTADEKIPKSRR
jgi:hypothetical protein